VDGWNLNLNWKGGECGGGGKLAGDVAGWSGWGGRQG
jgi:hypothetical protein